MPAAPRPLSLSIQEIRSAQEFAAIADDWERCNEAFGQTCCEGHLDHLLRTYRGADGSGALMAVLLYEGDQLVGMAPLASYRHQVKWQLRLRRRRWTVLSFEIEAIEFVGDRLLVVDQPDARQALLQGVLDACRPFAITRFRYLHVGAEPWRSITSKAGRSIGRWAWKLNRAVSLEIRVRPSFEEYARTVSKKARHNFRREVRVLSGAAGTPLTLRTFTEVSEVPELLAAAGRVFENSWHARHGATRIGPGPKAEERLRWLASRGWLRAYVLSKGDEPIAFILGRKYRQTFTAHRAAFALSWSRYSPGKVLWWLAIEEMHNSKAIERINFGMGDWEYKRVLATDTREVSNVWLIKPSWQSAMAWSGPWAYRTIRNLLETGLRVTSVGDPIMKYLRRNMAR